MFHDIRKILTFSYTAWAFYALALLTIAPDLIYMLGVDTNPVVWGRLQLLVIFLGLLGRLVRQTQSGAWKRRAVVLVLFIIVALTSAPAMAASWWQWWGEPEPVKVETVRPGQTFNQIAFDLISKWEGKRNHSYLDIVGVWTICYGHTRTAGPGQHKTDTECRALLIEEIQEYREGLHAYFTAETKRKRLPPTRDAAYTSLAFNVGIRGAGRSTATRRLNAGDIAGGCEALTWWNKAGGRVVRGLVNRRSEERDLCMAGLS